MINIIFWPSWFIYRRNQILRQSLQRNQEPEASEISESSVETVDELPRYDVGQLPAYQPALPERGSLDGMSEIGTSNLVVRTMDPFAARHQHQGGD